MSAVMHPARSSPGALGAAGYGIYCMLQSYGVIKTKKRPAKKVEVKKAGAGDKEEWLKGTYYSKGGSKKVAAAKGKPGPKLEEAVEVKKAA